MHTNSAVKRTAMRAPYPKEPSRLSRGTPRSADHAQRSPAAPAERMPAWTRGDTPAVPILIATWPAPQMAQRASRRRAATGSRTDRGDTWSPAPSDLRRSEPGAREGGRRPDGELIQEARRTRLGEKEASVLWPHEALAHGVAEESEEVVPVARDVHEADGLPVDAELGPREDLQGLLEGPEPARQRHEAVGEARHQGLALVHAGHDVEVTQPRMGQLRGHQAARDDPHDLAAPGEHGVGEGAHEAGRAAAVDEADPAGQEL